MGVDARMLMYLWVGGCLCMYGRVFVSLSLSLSLSLCVCVGETGLRTGAILDNSKMKIQA